jgi:hypothetical protein
MTIVQTISPEDFGAVGDGSTDDQAAFDALNAYLAAHDGGRVTLRPGAVYLAGKQTTGGLDYLSGAAIIDAADVSVLIVDMNGATIRFNGGMKFGSFDPATGDPISPTLPFYDHANAASLGFGIRAVNVGRVEVRSGTIDGNSQEMEIGGLWGDQGRQLAQAGVGVYGCEEVVLEDVEVVNSCLDGFVYAYTGLAESDLEKPFAMKRCRADKVARNGLSIVGTNSALVEQCELSRSGEADNDGLGTSFGSSPASCIDVEAEAAICRNVVIRQSRLIAGAHTNACFVADSGDSADILLEDTMLVGAVWTSKPRTIFSRCDVYGRMAKLAGGFADPRDNTRFLDGHLSDTVRYEAVPVNAAGLPGNVNVLAVDLQGAGAGVVFERSTFDIANSQLNLRGGILRDVTINFSTGTDKVADHNFAIIMEGATFERVTIVESIPSSPVDRRPTDGFYIGGPTAADLTDCRLVSPAGKLRWVSWSVGAGGYVGEFDNHEDSVRTVGLFKGLGTFSDYYGRSHLYANDAAPSSGTYVTGDVVLNQAPTAGGKVGWVCTAGGSPGTWKAFGAIDV